MLPGIRSERVVLIIAVFIAGLCSIVYELLVSATSSYFLGDSVKQFSLIIGVYMAAMGVGSFLSQYLDRGLLVWFVFIELALGFMGGAAIPVLYGAFHGLSPGAYQGLVLGVIFLIGALTGFEIPLLTRIMKAYYPLKANLANVLSLDYIGALAATLLFPFVLLPDFGLFRTGVAFGLLNVGMGLFVYGHFQEHVPIAHRRWVGAISLLIGLLFAALLWRSGDLLAAWEGRAYPHRVVYAEQTPYQHLAITHNAGDFRLYINRVIQFSSLDEHRYHEALALIPAAAAQPCRRVLILGGGEGLLAREVLKLPEVESVTVVDLDERVFALAGRLPALTALNDSALADPRVQLLAEDAALFLRSDTSQYDLILADLPDPSSEAVARLYSTFFFRLIRARLSVGGAFATQATSPFHSRKAFWCIHETVRAAGFAHVYPYHVYVPSFGEWGFVMATLRPVNPAHYARQAPTRYLEETLLPQLFYFDRDLRAPAEGLRPNTLDRPSLLGYYLSDWSRWQREESYY